MSWRVRWNVVPVLLPLSLVLAGRARTRPVDEATGADTVVALVGGKVYRSAGSEPIGDGIILIRNGRVAVVGGRASVRVPPEARVIDCRGLVVVPGFWNSHVHFHRRTLVRSRDGPRRPSEPPASRDAASVRLRPRGRYRLVAGEYPRAAPPDRAGRGRRPSDTHYRSQLCPSRSQPFLHPARQAARACLPSGGGTC